MAKQEEGGGGGGGGGGEGEEEEGGEGEREDSSKSRNSANVEYEMLSYSNHCSHGNFNKILHNTCKQYQESIQQNL
jgi:hypothetical protein